MESSSNKDSSPCEEEKEEEEGVSRATKFSEPSLDGAKREEPYRKGVEVTTEEDHDENDKEGFIGLADDREVATTKEEGNEDVDTAAASSRNVVVAAAFPLSSSPRHRRTLTSDETIELYERLKFRIIKWPLGRVNSKSKLDFARNDALARIDALVAIVVRRWR